MKVQHVVLTAALAALFGTACGPARPTVDAGCQGILCNVTGGGTASNVGGGSAGGGTATNGGGTTSNGGGTTSNGGGTTTNGGGTATNGGGTTSNGGGTTSNGGGTATNGGGTATGGGSSFDGGVTSVTVATVRTVTYCSQRMNLTGAVVTAVDSLSTNTSGATQISFWVADQNNAGVGVQVFKRYADSPTSYAPAVGDIISIDGFLSTVAPFNDRIGYRQQVTAGCNNTVSAGIPMTITLAGTMAPLADNTAPAGFGINPDGGLTGANKSSQSTRVFIPGPLTLTNPSPTQFKRISLVPNDSVYFGFEVTGGVLVNNYRTFGTTQDGGSPRCDWRAMVSDGGTVTFPNGIHGVWDTYTHAPCADGGTASGCFRNAGGVPGTTATYTYVLYPLDCANDLNGTYTP